MGPTYAKLFTDMVANVIHPTHLQYVLAIIDELLQGASENTGQTIVLTDFIRRSPTHPSISATPPT